MNKFYEILESIADRFKNPLLLSFLASWVIVNYRLFVVLWSDEHYEAKFHFISSRLYGPETNVFAATVGWPFVGAVFYVLILPAISLASTWASAFYQDLHNRVTVRALKKAVLSAEQKEAVDREMAALANKLQRDVQEARTARFDSSRLTKQRTERMFACMLPLMFKQLQADGATWTDTEKLPATRELGGRDEQIHFARTVGFPRSWRPLIDADTKYPLRTVDAATLLRVPEAEAIDILLRLAALGVLMIEWLDDEVVFVSASGNWISALTGKPA